MDDRCHRIHIADGKVYLSPVMDIHNREIVSFDISIRPNFQQTMNMLNQAFEKHTDLNGLIFHSDQGWQYQMPQYHSTLKDKGTFNQCHARETVWIIHLWKTSLAE